MYKLDLFSCSKDNHLTERRDFIPMIYLLSLQMSLLVVSIFVPIKLDFGWLFLGTLIYFLSLLGFIWSIHSYAAAPPDKVICNGIYRWSRNPMYVCYFASVFGTCIASASIWMLILLIGLILVTHCSILGEERFCEATYGESYKAYKRKTPRYGLIK